MYYLFSPSQVGPSDKINIWHKDTSFGILRVAGKQAGSKFKGKIILQVCFREFITFYLKQFPAQ